MQKVRDLTPGGIVTTLDLLKPNYRNTAAYGHVGRSDFGRERSDRVGALQEVVGLAPAFNKLEETELPVEE